MNVSSVARQLKVTTQELLEKLPSLGFDVGLRAIKIDDKLVPKIVSAWKHQQKRDAFRATFSDIQEIRGNEGDNLTPKEKKELNIPEVIIVKDLAELMRLPVARLMAELMRNGIMVSLNEKIDFDTASIIAEDLGFKATKSDQAVVEESSQREKLELLLSQRTAKTTTRPPVVVVMGHVDHGKTKLLDAIRETNVVDQEAGGITQHIGAYQVVKNGKLLTFIDTPGHEAFTTMRSRGARVADVAILVIAADDSIQPQTKESIKIINSAGLPMIVAINKIDKPEANPDKVKQDLAALNLVPEEWGGKTICVPISAKQGIGIEDLLEMILLVAETEKEEIMANPAKPAVGTIVESHIDKGEGPVATVLIQNGTLKNGDLIDVGGTFYGKIRAMKDFKNDNVVSAPPSMPVKILGLKAAPSVGDILQVITEIAKKQRVKKYQLNQQATDYTKLAEVKKEEKTENKSLNLILKADVLGSLEAIINSLTKLENPEVSINIISKGLGNINENDIKRAESGKASIFGFRVKLTSAAESLAKEKKVDFKLYEIIYRLLDDIKAKVEELLSPEVIRTDLGRLKVLAVFRKESNTMVIGGSVTKGKVLPKAKIDVIRDKIKLATGSITQLQVNKVDVNEASLGQECGIKYSGKPVIVEGDFLEVYQEEVKEKKI